MESKQKIKQKAKILGRRNSIRIKEETWTQIQGKVVPTERKTKQDNGKEVQCPAEGETWVPAENKTTQRSRIQKKETQGFTEEDTRQQTYILGKITGRVTPVLIIGKDTGKVAQYTTEGETKDFKRKKTDNTTETVEKHRKNKTITGHEIKDTEKRKKRTDTENSDEEDGEENVRDGKKKERIKEIRKRMKRHSKIKQSFQVRKKNGFWKTFR